MASLEKPPARLLDGASLFLDFDGTLAEFVAPDAEVEFGESGRTLLRDLLDRLDGRVAVVSGRTLDSLHSTLELQGMCLAGSHGLELHRADGSSLAPPEPKSLARLIAEAEAFAAPAGLVIESKPAGVAIHYRDKPEQEQAVDAFAREAADRHGLLVQAGTMVREIRAPGWHKGDVVRALMTEPPFDRGIPLFVGDDLTDEDGFAAAAATGGHGILVGAPRETAAHFGLPSVAAVHDWLAGR